VAYARAGVLASATPLSVDTRGRTRRKRFRQGMRRFSRACRASCHRLASSFGQHVGQSGGVVTFEAAFHRAWRGRLRRHARSHRQALAGPTFAAKKPRTALHRIGVVVERSRVTPPMTPWHRISRAG